MASLRAPTANLSPQSSLAFVRKSRPTPLSTKASGANSDTDCPDAVQRGDVDGRELGVALGEGGKAVMAPDVVDQHDPAGLHDGSGLLHLEQRVLERVEAVVDEQVHLADLLDQGRHPLAALALHVRPAGAALL